LDLPEQEQNINFSLSRRSIPTVMRIVGSLFPNFDLFKADKNLNDLSNIDRLMSKIKADMTTARVDSELGTDPSDFKTLLCLMLNAFGLNQRKARFEADLVCCWASMCNVGYPYSRDDSLARSLQKVVRAIRGRGVRLYNFTVNARGGAGLEVDLLFLDHAAFYTPHVTTLDVAGPLEAALFSGVIVTERHLQNAVNCREARVDVAGAGVGVHAVANSRIASLSLLSDVPAFNAQLEAGVVEQWGAPGDGRERHVWAYGFALDGEGVDRGDDFVLAVAEVDVGNSNVAGKDGIKLWAVCPARFAEADLFVAVETINRTLVLAARGDHGGGGRAVAYLTNTDGSRTSRVVEVDASGRLRLPVEQTVWNHPRTEGIQFVFEGTVVLSNEVLTVY
jgi:hypothetical protein